MDRNAKDINALRKGSKSGGETRTRPQDLCTQIRKQGERAIEIVNGYKGLNKETKKSLQSFITNILEQANEDLPKARGSAAVRFTQMQEERNQALHRIKSKASQVREILSLLRKPDNSEAIKSYLGEAMRNRAQEDFHRLIHSPVGDKKETAPSDQEIVENIKRLPHDRKKERTIGDAIKTVREFVQAWRRLSSAYNALYEPIRDYDGCKEIFDKNKARLSIEQLDDIRTKLKRAYIHIGTLMRNENFPQGSLRTFTKEQLDKLNTTIQQAKEAEKHLASPYLTTLRKAMEASYQSINNKVALVFKDVRGIFKDAPDPELTHPDLTQLKTSLKDFAKQLDLTKAKLFSETIQQFKPKMSEIFHSGYIQALYEKRLTFSVIDRITEHSVNPKIKHGFINILQQDIPRSHPSFPDSALYHAHVQTARALQYARNYISHLSALADDPSLYLDSNELHAEIANATMEEQSIYEKDILKDPDSIIFSGTKYKDHSRQNTAKIDAGHASPQKAWTDDARRQIEEILHNDMDITYVRDSGSDDSRSGDSRSNDNVHGQIEETLHTNEWQKKPPGVWQTLPGNSHETWQTLPGNLPQTRLILDLSSLQLSYEGQPLLSLKVIYYDIENTQYITSELNTTDNTYYTPETDKEWQDIGFQVREQVRPFLSGTQYERDTAAQKKDTKLEINWQNTDDNWRLREENRTGYYTEIHPAMAHYTQSIIEDLVRQGQTEVTILDIAGGNGDLGERIIKDTQAHFPKLSITYALVEGNKTDVNLASERFRMLNSEHKGLPKNKTSQEIHRSPSPDGTIKPNITAFAVHRNMGIYHFDAEEMKRDPEIRLPQEGVDIVINCGGMLNKFIASDTQEAEAYFRMYMELGRFLVSSGRTSMLVNADYIKKDPRIEICNLFDEYSKNQMYVVRRLHESELSKAAHTEAVLNIEGKRLTDKTADMPIEQQRQEHQQWLDLLPQKYKAAHTEAVLNIEGKRLIDKTADMPIEQQRQEHQQWLDLLPQEYKAAHTEAVLNIERERLTDKTAGMPIEQQRQEHQQWLNLLPQKYKAVHIKIVLNTEGKRLTDKTADMPIEQQRQKHQQWLELLPQEYKVAHTEAVLNIEGKRLTDKTADMPIEQQHQEHQQWLDLLPQEYKAIHIKIVLNTEGKHLTDKTADMPIEQQRQKHQQWLELLPQEYKVAYTEAVLNIEGKRLTDKTADMPIEQQHQEHQQWLDLLPQEYQAIHIKIVLNIERKRLTDSTQNIPNDEH